MNIQRICLRIADTKELLCFDKKCVTVGRNGCDCTIGAITVSRHHATFVFESGKWFLIDEESKNGTKINGLKICPSKKYPVKPNDTILFADVRVIMEEDDSLAEAVQMEEDDSLAEAVQMEEDDSLAEAVQNEQMKFDRLVSAVLQQKEERWEKANATKDNLDSSFLPTKEEMLLGLYIALHHAKETHDVQMVSYFRMLTRMYEELPKVSILEAHEKERYSVKQDENDAVKQDENDISHELELIQNEQMKFDYLVRTVLRQKEERWKKANVKLDNLDSSFLPTREETLMEYYMSLHYAKEKHDEKMALHYERLIDISEKLPKFSFREAPKVEKEPSEERSGGSMDEKTMEFALLTRHIPELQKGNYGKVVGSFFNSGHAGTAEDPIPMPYIEYSDEVNALHHDIYDFCKSHPEYDHRIYHTIFEENGLKWNFNSMSNADVSKLDAKAIIALFIGVFSAERFCDGAMMDFLENGSFIRWLKRLEELDGSNPNTNNIAD